MTGLMPHPSKNTAQGMHAKAGSTIVFLVKPSMS